MSSFKGRNLFGSGPHRVRLGPLGESVVANYIIGLPGSGSTPQGPIELDITVEGRLVAGSGSALAALVATVESELISPPEPGTFIDNAGRVFEQMSFIRFERTGPTDRARSFSIPFTATFRRFNP